MKHPIIKGLTFLIFISLLSFDISAAGLQDYLQNTEIASSNILPASEATASITTNSQFTHIIELVVAGIVASALILSILVLFLGRWAGNREKKVIKAIRIEAEKEKNNVISSASTVREQERETSQLVQDIKEHVDDFTTNKTRVKEYEEEVFEASKHVKAQTQQIDQVTEIVSDRLDKIQDYWDEQLNKTVSSIHLLQENLDKSLNKVDEDIEKIQLQKNLSQELLQDFLSRHHEQSDLLSDNSEKSEKVGDSLDETFTESQQLIKLLKQHQESAEKSLKTFTEELTVYEEQAYEQFDTSFQVTDLARQELNANVDESRKHIETMRRHEEQSHGINVQTHKNLEALDYAKITKLSNTIDTTQNMFTDMQGKIEETQHILNELRDIETDIRKTASNVESHVEIAKTLHDPEKNDNDDISILDDEHLQETYDNVAEYKMVSGDNTPISFFKNIKKTPNQKND